MHRLNWKSLVSLLMLASLLGMLLPLGAGAGFAGAEEGDASDDGWRYVIDADGYASVIGYDAPEAAALTVPRMLGGAYVVRLAEDAFAGNAALQEITLPAAVAEIPASAFPAHQKLTVAAPEGSAAMAFAKTRGFSVRSVSDYDLCEGVLDLSEMTAAQYRISGMTAVIGAPYAVMITAGDKLMLPVSQAYPNGLPVEVLEAQKQDGEVRLTLRMLEFTEAVDTYSVEHVSAVPDFDRMVILAEGFTPLYTAEKGSISGSVGTEIAFAIDYDTGKGKSITGKLSYSPDYEFTLSYSHFKLEEFSYTNKSKTALSVTYKDAAELTKSDPETEIIRFAKLPLKTPSLVSVWLELSMVVTVEGEVTVETSINTTESMTWTPEKGAVTSKTHAVDYLTADAAIGINAELKMAILVNLGFSATDFNLDIAELSVAVGPKATVKFLDSETDCKDLDIANTFKVSVRLGILSSDWPKVSLDTTLFSLQLNAITLHMEFDPFRIVQECTKDTVTVTFTANGGVNAPAPVKMKRGSLLLETAQPSRSGYTFTGWYTDSSCSVLWEMKTAPVTQSMTLYAGWEETPAETTAPPEPAPTPALAPVPDIPLQSASASLGYLKYVIVNEETVTINGYTDKPVTLTIPSTIEGLPVTCIGNGAFAGCSSLKRVSIPSSVEVIGSYAFQNCKNLVIADIPMSLKEMGSNCFSGCKALMEAYIPGDLEVIGVGMFSGCSALQKATVGGGLTLLPGTTFSNCGALVEVSLGSSIESIGGSAFAGCDSLQEIRLPASLKTLGASAFSGCSLLHTADIPAGVEIIGDSAFSGCVSLLKVRVQGALTELGGYAFSGCTALTEVYFACPLETLPAQCFRKCTALEAVTLPSGLKTIGGSAFEGCTALEGIRFPSALETIGASAFVNCTALETVEMQPGLTDIGTNAFNGCMALKSPDFPFTLEMIGTAAFSGCDAMETVELSGSGMIVGPYAFKGCDSLKTVRCTGVKELQSSAFYGCKALDSVTLIGMETIGGEVFSECDALPEIKLPEGLMSIGKSAFSGCDKLAKVTFPLSLETLDSNAFNSCIALSEVKISGRLTTMGTYVFNNCTGLTAVTLNTPMLTTLPNSTFRKCTALVTVTLPDAMTKIDANAFFGCSALTDVVWPSSLKTIEANAFESCTGMKQLKLPEGLTTLKNGAFSGCIALEELRLPDSLTTLGSSVFSGCRTLTEVRVPGSIRTNGGYTFSKCTSLATVTLTPGLTTIANSMFSGCSALTEVMVPDTLTAVEANAFSGCTKLPHITLGTGVASIGVSAFDKCSALGCLYVYDLDCPAAKHFAAKYPRVIVALVGDRVTIQYDTLGGSHIPSMYSAPGALLAPPQEPEWADYTFTGWYTDAECTQMWNFLSGKVPAGGLILYAGWNYTPADMKYLRNGEGVTLTDYSGNESVLTIPEELDGYPVTAIGKEALNDAVTVVHIPATVTDVSNMAFRWAENLTTIIVAPDNPAYYSRDGVLYSADGTLCCYPRGRAAGSFAPDEGTTAIGAYAFYDADGLSSLVIPSCVTSLEPYAVYDCDTLKSVVFQSDLTPGDGCFLFCHDDLCLTGPVDAPDLAAYADRTYLRYNEYNVVYMENGELLGATRVRAGKLLGQPPQPEDGELTFAGWSETGKESELWDFERTPMPATELTLHAVWRLDFKTRPAKDGGVELVNYTGDKNVVHIPDQVDGKPVVAIADDCFPDESVTITGNSGSVAQAWAEKKGMTFLPLRYTVTFVSGGGTQVPALSLCAGEAVPEPDVFRQGFTLDGWYTDPYYASKFDFTLHTMPACDLTLYAAWTAEADAEDIPFTFEETGEGLMITGYTGGPGAAAIPERINGMLVTAIAPYAFQGQTALQGLTIPDSVRTIGEGALSGSAVTFVTLESGVEELGALALADCVQLTSLTLPDTIHTLGHHALQGCSALSELTIPNGVTALPEGLLSGCTFLENVVLPEALQIIGSQAFAACPRLSTLALPASVQIVDCSAFRGCTGLTALTVQGEYFRSVDGVLLTADGKTLLCYPQGKPDASWTVPEGVEHIAPDAMAGAVLTELTLSDTVETIGTGALRGCVRLTAFNSGKGLQRVGSDALAGCMSLTTVRLNDEAFIEVRAIPALNGLTIYAPVSSLARGYAAENGIRFVPELHWLVRLPEALTEIRAQAFDGTAFTTVYCPDGVTTIGDEAFAGSALVCIRLPESVTDISGTAFAGLTELVIVAPAGSAAQRYAEQLGIAFIAE